MNYYVELNEEQIDSKMSLESDSCILSYDSKIFFITIGDKLKVLKKFNENISYDFIQNKLLTIGLLIENADAFDERFILPEKVAFIYDDIVGYIMNYIDNYNLSKLLASNSLSTSEKKNLLKQAGNILLFTDELRKKNNKLKNFYIGDLNVFNFMYDKERKILTVGDLDSCCITIKVSFPSLYLKTSPNILFVGSKYPLDYNGENIPNRNTDIYCYIIMILNFLYGGETQRMSFYEYYNYLEYLKDNGMPLELIDIFARIYESQSNINPVDLIDAIPDDISKFHKNYCKLNVQKN